jgi:hypothetical protein
MLLRRIVPRRSQLTHASVLLVGFCGLAACGRVGLELVPVDDLHGGSNPGGGRMDASGTGTQDAGDVDAGVCPTACESSHGTASCESGSCVISCELGFADCDADPSNGCEASTDDELLSCGSCAQSCSNGNGATMCSAGLCSPSCNPSFGDCDANAANGCEADLGSVQNCGACGASCLNPNGSTACVAGDCQPSCAAGFADCDGFPENGCETNINSDPRHCGSCPSACGTNGQICVGGSCQASPCTAGRGECDGDLAMTCETDIDGSVDNCGFCGNRCNISNGSARCSGGSCAVNACNGGFDDCDDNPANGCETTLASSVAHCGACGAACQNPNGTTNCVASSCAPSCSTGFGDCDSSRPNGCETALDSVSNCGTCGRTCPANGGTPVCNAGVCNTVCNLTGTFALKMSVQGTWPDDQYIASGSGTFQFWMKLQGTHSGTAVAGTLLECGRFVPDFDARTVNETFGFTHGTSLFDQVPPYLPTTAVNFALANSSPGASMTLPRCAMQMGARMSDPVNGAWPNAASGLTSVDDDLDGESGVTVAYRGDSGYDYPRTGGTLGAERADNPYIASRVSFSLNGTLNSCTQATGSASFTHIDTRIFGCSLANSNQECDSGEANFLDQNCLNYTLGSATFTLVKVADGASCAQIRAALP